MPGLLHLLNTPQEFLKEADGRLDVDVSFVTPGFMTALAVLVSSKRIDRESFQFLCPGVADYASAMGFSAALWDHDDYGHNRVNEGATYSPLVYIPKVVADYDIVNEAAGRVISCVDSILDGGHDEYARGLKHVVGETHDNVASHSEAAGFSAAQQWKLGGRGDPVLEFAICDGGLGLLGECQRVGLAEVTNHREAIAWCITKGNSTKNLPGAGSGEWAQYVPPDANHVPMPETTRRSAGANNHLGLGLHLLVDLTLKYGGSLILASGDQYLYLNPGGERRFFPSALSWQGVALMVQFNKVELERRQADQSLIEADAWMKRLGALTKSSN